MTGCRPQEVRTLEWDNVHFDKKQFIVRNCWSKSKKTLYKYLNQTALEVLERRSKNRIGSGFSPIQQLISQLIVIINAL